MEYKENWDALDHILYETEISKASLDEIVEQVETIEEGVIRAFLGNNQETMADLLRSGEFIFTLFESELSAEGSKEAKSYFKLGELYGAILVMSRIVSNIVEDKETMNRFNNIQKRFSCAKDIILYIGGCGSSAIQDQEKNLLENMSHGFEKKDLTDALCHLNLNGFVYSQKYGPFCKLFLSDTGRVVYSHYK